MKKMLLTLLVVLGAAITNVNGQAFNFENHRLAGAIDVNSAKTTTLDKEWSKSTLFNFELKYIGSDAFGAGVRYIMDLPTENTNQSKLQQIKEAYLFNVLYSISLTDAEKDAALMLDIQLNYGYGSILANQGTYKENLFGPSIKLRLDLSPKIGINLGVEYLKSNNSENLSALAGITFYFSK